LLPLLVEPRDLSDLATLLVRPFFFSRALSFWHGADCPARARCNVGTSAGAPRPWDAKRVRSPWSPSSLSVLSWDTRRGRPLPAARREWLARAWGSGVGARRRRATTQAAAARAPPATSTHTTTTPASLAGDSRLDAWLAAARGTPSPPKVGAGVREGDTDATTWTGLGLPEREWDDPGPAPVDAAPALEVGVAEAATCLDSVTDADGDRDRVRDADRDRVEVSDVDCDRVLVRDGEGVTAPPVAYVRSRLGR
jgi:hypothetical protein